MVAKQVITVVFSSANWEKTAAGTPGWCKFLIHDLDLFLTRSCEWSTLGGHELPQCVFRKVLVFVYRAWNKVWATASLFPFFLCHLTVAVVFFGIEVFQTGGRSILCWNSPSLAVLQGTRQCLFIWFSSCLVSLVFCLFCFVELFFSPPNFCVEIPWTSFLFILLACFIVFLKVVCFKLSPNEQAWINLSSPIPSLIHSVCTRCTFVND